MYVHHICQGMRVIQSYTHVFQLKLEIRACIQSTGVDRCTVRGMYLLMCHMTEDLTELDPVSVCTNHTYVKLLCFTPTHPSQVVRDTHQGFTNSHNKVAVCNFQTPPAIKLSNCVHHETDLGYISAQGLLR